MFMKAMGLFFVLLFNAHGTGLSILHYNIKELSSYKLHSNHNQLNYVKKHLGKLKSDIFAVNELQYDFPHIPSKSYTTLGKNLNKLAKILDFKDMDSAFYPANTGKDAKPLKGGNFAFDESDPALKNNQKISDPVNYGIFPGEYSTGVLTKYKILERKIITNLKWLEFNRSRDLTKFRDDRGKPLDKNILLFDKNFTDLTILFENRRVHLIAFHAVPAFGFGNKQTMNYARNQDQLRFLEWYLTGSTDISVSLPQQSTLLPDTPFIAFGDWNTDVNQGEDPGAKVLNRLFKKVQLVHKNVVTYETPGFDESKYKAQLDYIAHSYHFEILNKKVLRPDPKKIALGCGKNLKTAKHPGEQMVKVEYFQGQDSCHALVSKEYYTAKMASDHFPILVELKWR
jgi:hypothetical protein